MIEKESINVNTPKRYFENNSGRQPFGRVNNTVTEAAFYQ